MTPKVVLGEFVDIRHVSGEVEDIWNQQFFDIVRLKIDCERLTF